MLGLIVELIISWLLLWLLFKKSLLLLGITPTKSRLFNLLFGISIASVCCTLYNLSFVFFTTNKWTLNPEFTGQKLLTSSWWTLKSVLFEELIFRGALLYILIKKIGIRTACITSAICFGLYHWFTSSTLGNPLQMAIIFITTGVWGAMFAMAFAKTKSLYLPIGLHFGWNFISTVIFSQGPLGNQFLTLSGGQNLNEVLSVVVLIFQLISVPLITYWYIKLPAVRHLQCRTTDKKDLVSPLGISRNCRYGIVNNGSYIFVSCIITNVLLNNLRLAKSINFVRQKTAFMFLHFANTRAVANTL